MDGAVYPNVGVRFRGASSYFVVPEGLKRSLNLSIDFINKDQHVYGYKTLNLLNCNGDPSTMSSALYSSIAGHKIATPKVNFVKVVINGENWGIYANSQQFNKVFLGEHFGTAEPSMPITSDQLLSWCQTLLAGQAAAPHLTLPDYVDAIPDLDGWDDLPRGTTVLIRGDVDAKPGETIGEGDVRLRSMVDTLRFGRQRDGRQIIFGHIGRKPDGTLAKVAARIGELLETDVPLLINWLDADTTTISDEVATQIADAPAGSVLLPDPWQWLSKRRSRNSMAKNAASAWRKTPPMPTSRTLPGGPEDGGPEDGGKSMNYVGWAAETARLTQRLSSQDAVGRERG